MIPGPAGAPPEGGEAQLEADVMRFVAILALCLVAISTLVSAPIAEVSDAAAGAPLPAPVEPAEPAAARAQIPASPEPPSAPVGEPRAARPEPFPEPASPAPSPAPSAPDGDVALPLPPPAAQDAAAAPPAARPPAPTPAAEPAPDRSDPAPDPGPAPARRPVSDAAPRGFVLRFESDAVLLRLAAAGRVGVYAMAADGALQLRLGAAGAEMVPGPTPVRFHVMDPATVPPALRQALARAGAGAPDRTWAVTLPAASRDALAELMRRYEDGELVIGPRGDVRRLAHEG